MRETKFIHITDPHLLACRESTLHNIPIYKVQKEIVSSINKIGNEIEFIIITGDISEDGTEESYLHAKEIFSHLSQPIFWIAGNHDNLGLIGFINNGKNIKNEKTFKKNGVNFILLNSVVVAEDGKNRSRGVLTHLELQFLQRALEINPGGFNVIALHHPPVKLGSWQDDRMLENNEVFLDLIKRFGNVQLVLYGHQHQAHQTVIDETKFYSPPAASFQFSKMDKWAFESTSPGFGVITITNHEEVKCENYLIDFNICPIYKR